MKKTLKFAAVFFIVFSVLVSSFTMPVYAKSKSAGMEAHKTPKYINIVYDDSGSMINGEDKDATTNKDKIKRWAQAKYSLEAFISMLDDDDSLNIYKINGGRYGNTIKGSKKDSAVEYIHSRFKTGDWGQKTPKEQVENAGDNLVKYSAGHNVEPWLVVITDGVFDEYKKLSNDEKARKTEALLQKYGKPLKGNVIFIPISAGIIYNEKSFHCLPAQDVKDSNDENGIINVVQRAIDIIYRSSRNPVNGGKPIKVVTDKKTKKSYVDIDVSGVSVSQLIVFAQGENAEIGDTDNKNAKKTDDISVEYTKSENAFKPDKVSDPKFSFKNYPQSVLTDTALKGVVSTIKAKDGYAFSPNKNGKIRVNLKGKNPESLVVTAYYEPYVSIDYGLYDGKTKVLDENSEKPCVSPGEYTLKADIVDGISKKPLPEKFFVPNIDITVKGQKYSIDDLREGVKISLDKNDSMGKLDISAKANIINGRYTIKTEGMINQFKSIIVRETYSLEVDYDIPTSRLRNYKLSKVNYILGSLDKLSTEDKEKCIKATVSCYDTEGNPVKLDNEQWEAIQHAYNNSEDTENYCSIDTPGGDDSKVSYSEVEFEKELQDGKGVFYVVPQYYKDENGKEHKRKTTHTKYFHDNTKRNNNKYNCAIGCEITLPDVKGTKELAYSTSVTPAERKSAEYEISTSIWYSVLIFVIFSIIMGYLIKGRLPCAYFNQKYSRGKISNIYIEKNFEDLSNPDKWIPVDERDDPERMRIKRKLLSVIVPFFPQRGKLTLGSNDFRNGLTLRIIATDVFAREFVIVNPPSDFSGFKKSVSAVDKGFLFKIGETPITEEFFKKTSDKKSGRSSNGQNAKEFRYFACLKKYPGKLIVKCESARFSYEGYCGYYYKRFKAVLGQKLENSKRKKSKKKSIFDFVRNIGAKKGKHSKRKSGRNSGRNSRKNNGRNAGRNRRR